MREAPRAPLGGARPEKPAATVSFPVILFTAGGARFAVDAGAVKGIRERDEHSAAPGVADAGMIDFAEREWYRSLILLDDEVVPLVRTEHWRQQAREKGGSGDGDE